MYHISKIAALVVAAMMTMSVASIASAATITIENAGNIKTDHTYAAYQIFSGTLSADGKKLSDIVWGAGINDSAALLAALKNDATIGSKFTNASTANDVALALNDVQNDSTEIVAFSRVVADYVGTAQGTGTGEITGLDDGYYFVKDTTTLASEGTDALSAYVVQLVGTAKLNIKTDAPSIEKKLKNDGEDASAYRDANNVGIGDKVDYQITSKVPNMANYKQYYFIVHDTLSTGLTFNNDVAIKVGTKNLVKDTDFTVTQSGTDIEIVFKNFIQYQTSQPGADITIDYTATVNDAAAIGVNGNPNEVYLEYSHNPNKEGKGEDKPGDEDEDDITGKTPKDTVITYSTNLKIKKVDGSDNNKALAGVKFTISGYAENDKVTYTETYEVAENGTYYKLSDGTYTTIAPTTLTQGKYDSKDTKYNLVVKKGTETEAVTYAAKQGTTDSNGIIDIGALIADGSLPAGTYVIHEDSTLSGYNVLDHDIIVKVTAKVGEVADIDFENPETSTKVTWEVSGEGATVGTDGTIEIQVVNNQGATLPSTGGIGTTIFYVIGAILVLGAGILLVSKRRMAE